MKQKNDFTIYYIILGMFLVALFFGLACRITVLAASPDAAASETESTSEDHLSQEELDHILRVSEKFLEKNGLNSDQATASDAVEEEENTVDYDVNTYLTYPLDEHWIDENTTLNSALDDIYRIILSVRNILLLFFFAFIIYWFDKKFHAIINKLFGGR